ncbi:MAG: DUF4238 domain-containing protein [Flavobacteriales bacterium]|nr:DUF4238 domain-containing protein [Flavobacteriales bacterium]
MAGKKHHIIPQMHLRHFAGHSPKGHVWTYDTKSNEPRSATTENTAVETHFYSVQMEDGSMNTLMDDYITDVEAKAAPIYRNILDGKIPDKDQKKADFSTFLAIMYFRTTAMRKMSAELYADIIALKAHVTATDDRAFEASIRDFEKEEGRKLSEEQKNKAREQLLNSSGYSVDVPKEQTLIAMEGADKLAKLLFEMKWSVGQAKNHFFITSDNPISRRMTAKVKNKFFGDGGFQHKDIEVTFPLSPKRILIMNWKTSFNGILEIPRDYVYAENEQRAANSDTCLYSHVKHKKLMALARKHQDNRPKMIISGGIQPNKFADVRVPRKWKTNST